MTSDMEYQQATEGKDNITATSSNPNAKHLALSFEDDPSGPLASSTHRTSSSKKCLNLEMEEGPKGNSSYTIRRQALIEAVTTAMSKRLEPLQVAKETTNKPTKLEGHFPQGIYLGRQELE